MTTSGADIAFLPSPAVANIRRRLDHPVIDGDGHHLECWPMVFDILKELAGADVAQRYAAAPQRILAGGPKAHSSSKLPGGIQVRSYFGFPAENTLDRVTATFPELLYRRLEQLGVDYALLYPTFGSGTVVWPDDEVRQAAARAFNTYYSQAYADYRDRLEPVAVIPMVKPDEAVAELDYAVGVLGLKAVVMSGAVPRPGELRGSSGTWIDTIGHGSVYDYTPVWEKCRQLGVAPAFHGSGYGWGSRLSSTNYVYNHLGAFGAAQEAACRSLVMGGVPRKFPELRFAFLEGGVSWAVQLFADLLGHYEKRNRDAVRSFDPARLDLDLARQLADRYAIGRLTGYAAAYTEELRLAANVPEPESIDDFDESGITTAEDIVGIFSAQFNFGCEADDALNALAFDTRLSPRHTRLNALFASDIGHWDVPDMTNVLPEVWELVERGLLTERDFRDFTFGNVARMLTAVNPRFFEGTAIDAAVSAIADHPSATV
jgi:predicted TIM-barrel fold metal-dependent hydrolase